MRGEKQRAHRMWMFLRKTKRLSAMRVASRPKYPALSAFCPRGVACARASTSAPPAPMQNKTERTFNSHIHPVVLHTKKAPALTCSCVLRREWLDQARAASVAFSRSTRLASRFFLRSSSGSHCRGSPGVATSTTFSISTVTDSEVSRAQGMNTRKEPMYLYERAMAMYESKRRLHKHTRSIHPFERARAQGSSPMLHVDGQVEALDSFLVEAQILQQDLAAPDLE